MNKIMELAEKYAAVNVRFWSGEHANIDRPQVGKARAALEAAVQAQADEIEHLRYEVDAIKEIKSERNAFREKLDAATKVPFSDDELNALWKFTLDTGNPTAGNAHIRYARAIESAHNIKGTTP